MGKRVVIIASGETERRALPHLLGHLKAESIRILEVRIPPRRRMLTVEIAAKLVKASWFERLDAPPEKFILLLDTDGSMPEEVMRPFREHLPARVRGIGAHMQVTYAQRHLEAWYFGDEQGLREYLGGALGSVDASAPDEIENPKLHLKNLLRERAYTAVISEQIAHALDPQRILGRSLSFRRFVDAIRNGATRP